MHTATLVDVYEDGEGLSVAAVDDHPAILRGLIVGVQELLPRARFDVLGTSVDSCLKQISCRDRMPDLILLDLFLNDGTRSEDNVATLKANGHRVLLFTQETHLRPMAAAFRAGADGLVGKHEAFESLSAALVEVAKGGAWLTSEWAEAISHDDPVIAPDLSPRERETVTLYATGLPLKTVAHRLEITEHTAKEHLVRVKQKYADVGRGIVSRTDVYIRAVEDGLIPPPDAP